MKKTDAWIVLRFDDEAASSLKDYVAVKGVYDDRKAAQNVVERLSGENHDYPQYESIKSRRYTDEDSPESSQKPYRVQGFDLCLKTKSADNFNMTDDLETVQRLWNRFPFLPLNRRKQIFLPILSYLVELAIADELGGSVTDMFAKWDMELPGGDRIEVKTVILDPEGRKAPNLRFEKMEFDALAIVIFGHDLTIEAARLIPTGALEHYIRRPAIIRRPATKQSVNLRVTRQLLNDPSAIPLLSRSLHEEREDTQENSCFEMAS
ncbi:hypothetical protein QUF72_09240 [Desulfobacterales bacterium HSG2]|nr:hypothetical protein [Desulfobacterales bacterium HSG2]